MRIYAKLTEPEKIFVYIAPPYRTVILTDCPEGVSIMSATLTEENCKALGYLLLIGDTKAYAVNLLKGQFDRLTAVVVGGLREFLDEPVTKGSGEVSSIEKELSHKGGSSHVEI